LSRHVTLDEASTVKHTISQQVETMKTKLVLSHMVESDATPHFSVGSVSSEISLVVITSGDLVADINTEHIEKVVSIADRGTKRKQQK